MKAPSFQLLLALLALPVVSASAQLIDYTDGSQVNLLNAWNASLSYATSPILGSLTPDQTRYNNQQVLYFSSSANPAAILDFGTARLVQTVTDYAFYAPQSITNATVETSNDGVHWTSQAGTFTNPGGTATNAVFTMNTAVSARYVRFTPTAFNDPTYWMVGTIRAFGPSGALAGDPNLSVVANGGLAQPQSLTGFGGAGTSGGNYLIAPATEPMSGGTIYFLQNAGFKVDLGQTFKLDRGTLDFFNYTASVGQPLTITLTGSTDDISYSTLYTTSFTSNPSPITLFNYTFDSGATDVRYLKWAFSTADTADNTNINATDFAFFQAVPEPSTVALAALGASIIFYRLRRKQRNVQVA